MKITILTVVKNSHDTIEECVCSVQNQIYQNYEHIIIDGESSDGTLEKLYKLQDDKTKIISRCDTGLYDALNQSKDQINGEYIILLHSDDKFSNNDVLKEAVKELKLSSDIDALFCGVDFVDDKKVIVRSWNSKDFSSFSYLYGWAPPHTGIVMKTEVYKYLLPFNTKYKIAADYDFTVRLLLYSNNYAFSNIKIICMRVGGMSTKYINYFKILREDFCISNEHNLFVFSPIIKRIYKLFQLC